MKHSQMQIEDCFWSPIISKMCNDIIPYQYEVLNDEIEGIPRSHAIENFRIASGQKKGKYVGMLFQDSDVAKWIEAAAYSLKVNNNAEIREKIESVIDLIEQTQQEDGYLDTYYICEKPDQKLKNIAHGHEMYCAGHLLEAAVGYAEVTGEERFLHIMERYIKWFMDRIGPNKNQLHIYPGHPELELALYKLYQYTGNNQYLEFMKYILMERGKQPSFLLKDTGYGEQYHDKWFALEYHQAHKHILEQTEAVGHAVRAMYLYSGMADLAKTLDDETLFKTLKVLWADVTTKKMYITGAIGSDEHGEGFSIAYDLPNDRAYAETCASIGLFMWARRMLKLELNSDYADVMELALYNGISSGMSEDGKQYFYVNPLEVNPAKVHQRYDLKHVRSSRVTWFGCACCPPNVARILTSLEKYSYDISDDSNSIAIHLYLCGQIIMSDDSVWNITGKYLTDGKIEITYSGEEKDFTLRLRNPGWSTACEIRINGLRIKAESEQGYFYILRKWKNGDTVQLKFGITAQLVYANTYVEDDAGKVAVMRGPVVFCLEEADNGKNLSELMIGTIESHCENSVILNGYREHTMDSIALYSTNPPSIEETTIKAIPYSHWGNTGEGEMKVWVRKV